jgi:SAM-dependent methyltransferase
MPTVEQNYEVWDREYGWSQQGDEWSGPWGSAEAQWRWTVAPRIRSCVPAGTILEIAPGFGRWTHYLKDLCTRLVVVDLSERCIEACRQRFAAESHIAYHVNDGRSLETSCSASTPSCTPTRTSFKTIYDSSAGS